MKKTLMILWVMAYSARAAELSVPPASQPPVSPPVLAELKTGKISCLGGDGARVSGSPQFIKVGDLLEEKMELDTGSVPVTEVVFEDGSVMRLGEKTRVLFLSKDRVIEVHSGAVLFYSPEGHGGITLRGDQVSGQVDGSTVMGVRDSAGNFSFFVLESSGSGTVSGSSVPVTFLGAGQMTTVRSVGGEAPKVLDVHVDAIRDISPLFQEISTSLPSDPKVIGTIHTQADEIQNDVKLLSSLDDYKLTQNDPEALALAMICNVTLKDMGVSSNILLRPMDTAAGTEAGQDQGSGLGVVIGSFAAPFDARQEEAAPLVAVSTPPSTLGGTDTAAGGGGGGGEDPGGTDTAAGGGGGTTDSQPPPVVSPTIPGPTTPV